MSWFGFGRKEKPQQSSPQSSAELQKEIEKLREIKTKEIAEIKESVLNKVNQVVTDLQIKENATELNQQLKHEIDTQQRINFRMAREKKKLRNQLLVMNLVLSESTFQSNDSYVCICINVQI